MIALWLGLALATTGGEGLERFVAGDRDGAYPLLVRGIAEDPDELPPEAWLFRGAYERERGDWAAAAQSFAEGLQHHPKHPSLRLELATTLSWLGEHEASVEAYDEVLATTDDPVARAAAAEGRARVLWWGGKRRAALRQARALPDDTLARAIADDRPRELTVVAGVRATDGTSPRAGLRASMRTGRWTLYGSADRSTTGWALATSDTGWASIGGVAHTLGEHLVVDGSARSWWSSEGDTHAVAARVTTPAGSFAPYLGGMAGTDDLRLGELGLRVGGDERWASLGGTHRFTADPLAAATSVAVAGGASAGPASVRLDLTRGWFAPGPLDSLGGAVEVATGRGHAVGVEVSHLRGWLTRTDVMGTWSLSF